MATKTPKYAPARGDGFYPYVKTTKSHVGDSAAIVWAPDMKTAKQQYGWTRQTFTTVTIRRATPADVEAGA